MSTTDNEDLIETALDHLLEIVQERRGGSGDTEMVAIAFDKDADDLLVLDLEGDGDVRMPPVTPKPEGGGVFALWRWDRYPEMVEELRRRCGERTWQYCAIACAGRVVLNKDHDTILPAMYCYVETADEAEELAAIPDDKHDFLLAKISNPPPMIMVASKQKTPS